VSTGAYRHPVRLPTAATPAAVGRAGCPWPPSPASGSAGSEGDDLGRSAGAGLEMIADPAWPDKAGAGGDHPLAAPATALSPSPRPRRRTRTGSAGPSVHAPRLHDLERRRHEPPGQAPLAAIPSGQLDLSTRATKALEADQEQK